MLANAPIVASVPCVDLEGARAFYGGTLGLSEMAIPGGEDAPPGALYQCGQETRLLVYQRPTPTTADHTAASWFVADLDAVVDYLIGRGVSFTVYEGMPDVTWDERGVASMGPLKSAWFSDPEGNILSISQMP